VPARPPVRLQHGRRRWGDETPWLEVGQVWKHPDGHRRVVIRLRSKGGTVMVLWADNSGRVVEGAEVEFARFRDSGAVVAEKSTVVLVNGAVS
jgi:hypothetical protein